MPMEKNVSSLTPAALSWPMFVLLLITFLLNAGSGIGLWLAAPQTPIQQGWRMFHGWTIPPFLITLGVLWRVHILRAWRLRKNILSGVLTLGVFLALIVTGWMIYYSGSDTVQKQASSWHTGLGLGISFLLLIHAILGWRAREPS